MKSLEPFTYSFKLNDTELVATVFTCMISDIGLKLEKPYSGIKEYAHTMYLLLIPSNRNINEKNELTPKGIATIKILMERAYTLATYLENNREELFKRFKTIEGELEKLEQEIALARSEKAKEKASNKQDLKNGKLSQKDYMAFMKNRERLDLELTARVKTLKGSILVNVPSDLRHYDDEEMLYQYIATNWK